MARTFKQALAVRMPNGKPIGDATAEDLAQFSELQQSFLEEYEAMDDPASITTEDRAKWQARLDYYRELDEAMTVVREHLRG